MNIKVASEKTGLTKKAIKFYEDEGLIWPVKNSINNYREYSDNDITKLNLIGALRAVDIPIIDIKNVLHGEKSVLDIMKVTLDKLNENIDALQKSKVIIENIIDSNLQDYNLAEDYIKNLRETLELSMEDRNELLSKALIRIFPGSYGEMTVAYYKPFLDVVIDTEEKKSVWIKLVELLDEMEEADEYKTFTNQMNSHFMNDIEDINELQAETTHMVEKVKNFSDLERDDIIKKGVELLTSIENNDELMQGLSQCLEMTQTMVNTIGPNQKMFDEYLSVLSEDYRKYINDGAEMAVILNNEILKSTQLNVEDLLKKFI